MKLETAKSLHDALVSCRELASFTAGKSLSDYRHDRGLQLIVERLFEILGEAINRISKSEPELAEDIPEFRSIIGLRNRIVHGYDEIDDDVIWDLAVTRAPRLRILLEQLLKSFDGDILY